MTGRLSITGKRHRSLWILLAAALCAASGFVALDRADSAVGGFSPHVSEFSAKVPGAHVTHVVKVAPAARSYALARALVPLTAALIALGLALLQASEGHRQIRADRWVRRRGPPLAL